MSQDLVLVSGVTGFLGTQVALAYLAKGFRVRATARSLEKADEWNKKHSQYKDQIEWVVVEDVAAPGAFNEAIKDVTIFAHTASPFHYDVKDNEKDMLEPAINGTKNALEAAASEKSVKRMVITSSFASVLDLNNMPGVGTTYTDKDWNPATYEQAAKSDNPTFVYCASKKLAEEAAWTFVKEKKPQFALTTLCPPLITGPPLQVIKSVKSLNTSVEAVWAVVDPEGGKIPDTSFPVWTDVRDVADLHVLATTKDVAKNERYLIIAGHFDNRQVAKVIREKFPDQAKRVPEPEEPIKIFDHFATDSSKAERDFGFKWRTFEETVTDTAAELFKLEKELGGK